MPVHNPIQIYKQRIARFRAGEKRINTIHTILGWVKICILITGLMCYFTQQLSPPIILLLIFLFVGISIIHEKIINEKTRLRDSITLNQKEIACLRNLFPTEGGGAQHRDPDHRYAEDLDIFGHRSLFHFIDRSSTQAGRNHLAKWLRDRASKKEIRSRQEAVRELMAMIDHRQHIQLSGHRIQDSADQFASLFKLHREPYHFLNKKIFRVLITASPMVATGLCVGMFFGVSYLFLVGLMILHAIYIRRQRRHISHAYRIVFRSFKILKAYSQILYDIEQQPYKSGKLRRLQSALSPPNHSRASTAIKKLVTIAEWAELKANPALHFLFNHLFLWDLHCVLQLEKWRYKNDRKIRVWFRVMGELEALSSLANLHFNHPEWIFPTLSDSSACFVARDMGHPLIPQQERVCNDFQLNKDTPIAVITGPNMAGKSTFLKTIGVNLTLGLAGSPVCASVCSLPYVKLYSSMKVSDSLDKHFSLFYAELRRLKSIIDGMNRGEPVFFLIDEMLKGTNIKDRQTGSKALLFQLLESGAHGIIATHDMELTHRVGIPSASSASPATVTNLYFDGSIKGKKLLFDYKLRPGVCDSFNATILMKRAGIRIPK